MTRGLARARPSALTLLIGGLSMLLLMQTPAAGRTSRPCYPRGSHTVAASDTGRIYWRSGGEAQLTSYYACSLHTKRSVLLETFRDDEPYGVDGRLAGQSAAIGVTECLRDNTNCGVTVTSWDLRTRRQLRQGSASTGVLNEDFLLRRNGSMAFILDGRTPGPSPPDGREVWIVDGQVGGASRPGATGGRLVDSGSEIEPGSLALGGPHVYWTKAGLAESAAIN